MVGYVNEDGDGDIVRVEDGVEYVYGREGCLMEEGEIGLECMRLGWGLGGGLGEDGDVILVGEVGESERMGVGVRGGERGDVVVGRLDRGGGGEGVEGVVD